MEQSAGNEAPANREDAEIPRYHSRQVLRSGLLNSGSVGAVVLKFQQEKKETTLVRVRFTSVLIRMNDSNVLRD